MTLLLALSFVAVLLVVVLFKSGVLHSDVERSSAEVAQYIENFVSETGGDWDWDDFTSIKIRDGKLDAIRIRCNQIHDDHPPETDREWCSAAGREALMDIVAELDLDAA